MPSPLLAHLFCGFLWVTRALPNRKSDGSLPFLYDLPVLGWGFSSSCSLAAHVLLFIFGPPIHLFRQLLPQRRRHLLAATHLGTPQLRLPVDPILATPLAQAVFETGSTQERQAAQVGSSISVSVSWEVLFVAALITRALLFAKLTTGREIASRRRLKNSQKSKKFSLFDFSGLFDFSTFRFSGHFSTGRDFSTFSGIFCF